VFGTSMGWFHGIRLGYVGHGTLEEGKRRRRKGPRMWQLGGGGSSSWYQMEFYE